MRPSDYDTLLRALSFNPARIQRMKDIKWSEKQLDNEYKDRRTDINSKIRAFFIKPQEERTLDNWAPILGDIQEYNALVANRQPGLQPMITGKSIRTMLKTQMQPSRKELVRGYLQKELRGELE